MTVTLKDVAALAGVSRSAVSRTFTPGASVSGPMRRRVEAAAAQLGYAPSALAAALATGRTKLIGLVSNNFRNPVFLEVFDLFTRELQGRGLRPLIVNLTDEADPGRAVTMLRQYSVDAVIVASTTLPGSFAEAFAAARLPVVHCFGEPGPELRFDVVGIDNAACGRLAARTLTERGHGRPGFLGGPQAASSTRDRLAGFREGLPVAPVVRFAADYGFAAGRDAMAAALDAKVDGWFCADDVLSLGALAALRASGREVPGDVGVLGLNDMEIAGWDGVALTTIRQPFDAIIPAAVEAAIAAADDPDRKPQARVFPCALIERATLRPLPVRAAPPARR